MGRLAKQIERMRSNPRGVRFEELVRVLRACGYEQRNVRGSHYRFGPAAGGSGSIIVVRPHGGEGFCQPWDVEAVLVVATVLDRDKEDDE